MTTAFCFVDLFNLGIEVHPRVVGLPPVAYVEYFGKLPDGRDFIIFRPREEWTYDSFVGVAWDPVKGCLRPFAIQTVNRYRDGGTTELVTALGKFYFPSPFHKDKVATLDDRPLTVYERTPE